MEFFQGGAMDTSWLVENGISIVYTSGVVENNKLIKVNRNLYLLVE